MYFINVHKFHIPKNINDNNTTKYYSIKKEIYPVLYSRQQLWLKVIYPVSSS